MCRSSWAVLGVAIGIVFSTNLTFAQKSDKQIFDEKLPLAESDIMRMDETELRAFVGVLTDCRFLILAAGPHFRIVCNSARQKYRIEYHRDRDIDYVLALIEVAAEKHLTAMNSTAAPGAGRRNEVDRAITLEEIKRALESADADAQPSEISIIVNAEMRLQKAASRSFQIKRQP